MPIEMIQKQRKVEIDDNNNNKINSNNNNGYHTGYINDNDNIPSSINNAHININKSNV